MLLLPDLCVKTDECSTVSEESSLGSVFEEIQDL